MRLTELEPHFIRYETFTETWDVIEGDHETWRDRGCPVKPFTGRRHYRHYVESIVDAQGILFLCPLCFSTNNGEIGTHSCEVTFANRGVADDEGMHNTEGRPTRWSVSGDSFESLSTQPSILLQGGCGWHGYITNGEAA